jgi:hypothetical protein
VWDAAIAHAAGSTAVPTQIAQNGTWTTLTNTTGGTHLGADAGGNGARTTSHPNPSRDQFGAGTNWGAQRPSNSRRAMAAGSSSDSGTGGPAAP